MAYQNSCASCGKSSFARDDITGDLCCSFCGTLQQFDNYDAQLGGLNGPQGTFIRVGTQGTSTVYSYKEKKIWEAHKSIDELMYRLGLTGSRNDDVKAMISTITEGEFGQGDWFQILIGACAYVSMRKDNRSLPMAEVSDAVGCDIYELGRMVYRVIDFLGLRGPEFPEFDIVGSLERTLNNCQSFKGVEKSIMDRMRKQGIFLIQCAVKWFLTTGRRPLPMVVAVLIVVSQLNEFDVRIEDVAKEVHSVVSTCKTRYKELLEVLVKVAQVFPWGKDVNTKNIMNFVPIVIEYMEKKSMLKSEKKGLDSFQFDLDDAIGECLSKDVGYGYGKDAFSAYVNAQYSDECLSMMYDHSMLKGRRKLHKRKSRGQADLHSCWEWWEGKSAMSKKLFLKQLLEKDVGLETLPPSFISGCQKVQHRKERINAAKQRIDKIMHPSETEPDGAGLFSLSDGLPSNKGRKRKQMQVGDVDWEDLIIETLLIHQVKEEEIETGHYNTLLDLHVFNSGIV